MRKRHGARRQFTYLRSRYGIVCHRRDRLGEGRFGCGGVRLLLFGNRRFYAGARKDGKFPRGCKQRDARQRKQQENRGARQKNAPSRIFRTQKRVRDTGQCEDQRRAD